MKSRVLLSLVLCATTLGADEGMWRPGQLQEIESDLRALGLAIEPESLADLTAHPMNAVIWLGGCTASFVSPDGLVVTNHHCAYGSIQHNSTEENNLLRNGFLAAERSDELPARPGSRVLVTVEVREVTDRVKGAIPEGAGGRARYQAIEDAEKALIAECETDEGHRCAVRQYHGGLEYELIKQLEIRDVRLVYAPAGAIGRYGGDVDNWMWPRHTGDFSFYRAYVAPDGSPADHAEENVPYRPRHHLRVSTEGLSKGDLVMVAGYPGGTNRYRLADEVENVISWYYPTRREAFLEWLEVIETATTGDEDAALKYASLVAGLNNATKNYEGMLNGFARSDVVERKRLQEEAFRSWIEGSVEDAGRRAAYLSALEELEGVVAERQAVQERKLFYELLGRRSSLLGAARTLYRLAREKEKPDMEREPGYQERDLIRIREQLTRLDRSYDPAVDRAAWRHFIERYAALPADAHVEAFDAWFGIAGNTVDPEALDARLGEMYASTRLEDQEHRLSLMEASTAELEASEDPFLRLAVHLYDSDLALEEEDKTFTGRFDQVRPRYMEALIAFLEDRGEVVYPDANSTLRVTYGTVKGYSPADAVAYRPFTTVAGILEKDTGEDPFDSPPAQLEAIRQGDFGRWADPELETLTVNFLSTVDTTGGNSGSPTLNARTELVGLLFDGNWESIIADWDYIPAITRSIHVDVRYALWVMERLDGAHHLLREMGIEPEMAEMRLGG